MKFRDFLRVAVLLFGGAATALAAVSVVGATREDTKTLVYVAAGWWVAAAEAGVTLVIDSDAHGADTLRRNMRYGVATARRAWLTATQVANTRPWAELARLRKGR